MLAPVIAAWAWFQLRSTPKVCFRALAGLVLSIAAVLLPVATRNYFVGGEFHLTTSQLGPNLYIGNNPSATGLYVPLRFGRGQPGYERLDATELAEQATGRKLSPGEVSKYWVSQSWHYVQEQPQAWLRLMLRKWLLVWNATELGDSEDIYSSADDSSLLRVLIIPLHFGVLGPLAVFGALATWRQRHVRSLFLPLILIYALSVAAFFVFGRYRAPLIPLLSLLAAAGLWQAISMVRRRQFTRLAVGVGVAAAIAVIANLSLVTRDSIVVQTRFNLAIDSAQRGQKQSAIKYYQSALEIYPGFESARNNLGALLIVQWQTGRGRAADSRGSGNQT